MKRYIISTLVSGCNINNKFLSSIKTYAEHNNAEILIIPTKVEKLTEDQILDETILKKSKHLNRNFLVSLLPINPDQIDPLSGLDRLGATHKSFIYGSTKQRLKSVPSPSQTLPRMLMTPGAITHPTTSLTKRGLISNKDHVYGAIVVDIESRGTFHFRQVQADKDGCFIDLGKQYEPNRITRARLEACIPGDWHCGFTDPIVKGCVLKILNKYDPKYLILHDFFDGISVNHHLQGKYITKAQFGELNDLQKELDFTRKELRQLANNSNSIVIVKSNHDEFLDKWLDDGSYVPDTRNHVIGLELALAKAQGKDPLKYYLTKDDNYNNVTFLACDDSFKVSDRDIECGAHGHRGANGSRGSVNNLEKCYQNVVYGHSHSPEILRGAWVMGTSTHLKLNYNLGPSSWCQTLCMVYENGARQLINIINGSYVI